MGMRLMVAHCFFNSFSNQPQVASDVMGSIYWTRPQQCLVMWRGLWLKNRGEEYFIFLKDKFYGQYVLTEYDHLNLL